MGSCAAPSAKGDDKFITTDYLQQCPQSRDIYPSAKSNTPLEATDGAASRALCRFWTENP
ncbi:hypothetical protein FR011_22870 [Salmonella enterica]|nr:hypothetical protein [Salmonella enterica]EBI2075069.1 hypothetical protein [Salmonella enterica]ECI9800238.1 hypothetical protein [Salmonella enterica]ECK5830612.1 hypothetical protein [Salmonella enterica]ECL1227923.1 hypothetical protein [Salmonella enterica]